jgi:hypothetical protein
VLALHFAGPRGGATVLPVLWAVGAFTILLFVRSFGRRAVAFALAAAALFAWWSTIRPPYAEVRFSRFRRANVSRLI